MQCIAVPIVAFDGQEIVPDATEQVTATQETITENGVEDSINHWVSAITDGGTSEKKKKRKHKCIRVSEDTAVKEDIEGTVMECIDVLHKKKSKSKSKGDDQIVEDMVESMEADKTVAPEKKKKRKHKPTASDGPVDKKVKLQDDEVTTDSQKIKKYKKKVKELE